MPASSVRVKVKNAPGIYRRGSRYVFSYRHREKQYWRSAPSLKAARSLKAEVAADMARGEHGEWSRASFGAYARDWIASYEGRTTRGFRESTREGYRRALEARAIPFFDDCRSTRLADIDPREVKAYIAWLSDPKAQGKALSVSTVRNHLAAVRALLATAAEEGVIRTNPAAGVRLTGAHRKPKPARVLTRAELARFFAALPPEWKQFFEFLTHTGVRISEAVELRWKDIELGEPAKVRVRRQFYRGRQEAPKGSSGGKEVPLAPGMAQALRSRREASPEAFVFPSLTGTRLRPENVRRRVLLPALEGAGLEPAGFHAFRHSCASLLIENGKDIKQVQHWLGHATPGFTLDQYVHSLDDGLGSADFLDGVKGGGW